MKTVNSKNSRKETRNTPLKTIASAAYIHSKLDVAMGLPSGRWQHERLDSDEKVLSMISHVRQTLPKWGTEDGDVLDVALPLGIELAVSILEGNPKPFLKIASALTHKRKLLVESEDCNKFHLDILRFCAWNHCGAIHCQRDKTITPLDLNKLHQHLISLGHKFSDPHENQVPRTLRKACSKMGLVYLKKRRGRKLAK